MESPAARAESGAEAARCRENRSTWTTGRRKQNEWSGAVQRINVSDLFRMNLLSFVLFWCPCIGTQRGKRECREPQGERTSSSVRRPGQNSRSSSRSKERPASNLARKADTAGASASSRMLLTPRNWRWVFWVAILGPRRERPPWWLFECMWAAGLW